MTEHTHGYSPMSQEHAPEGIEVPAFGFGVGVADTDGVCSAVVLRMAIEMGGLTFISRAELTPDNARELVAKLLDMIDKVQQHAPVPSE